MPNDFRVIPFLNFWAVQHGDVVLTRRRTVAEAVASAMRLAVKAAETAQPCRVIHECPDLGAQVIWNSERQGPSRAREG